MKTKLRVSFVIIVALLICVSCTRPSFTLQGVHTGVSLTHTFTSEGILPSRYESLSVFIESEKDANLQLEVVSPDGLNIWLFPVTKKTVEKQEYYGKANLSIGSWMPLPRGEWTLRILRDDGRTITEQFTVETGSEVQSFHHQLDGVQGKLVLDEQVKQCSIQLLNEEKKSLYSIITTEQTLELASLYPKWEQVRFVVISWYDDSAMLSQIAWYAL